MSENTELAVIDSASLAKEITNLNQGVTGVFSTIQGDDHASKLAVLTATTNSVALADNLDKPINVKDVVLQSVDMADEKSGEIKAQPRVILIDDKGKAYHAISGPLFRDVKNWFSILGMPHTWEKPLTVKVLREGTGTSKYFTAKIA